MTYIIAEIGSNWTTSEEAVLSVTKARQCGAHAVKFQMFTGKELYGTDSDRFLQPDITAIYNRCQDLGIDFLCTAFSAKGVKQIDPYVRAHKVASAEMMDTDILDAVSDTGKPLYISTGGHTLTEVNEVLAYLSPEAKRRTVLLYCESSYPCNGYMPEKLGLLSRATGMPVGVSDHSREIYLSAWMCDHFAVPLVEKHVNLVGADGPDAPHSLDEYEFRQFCDYLKGQIHPTDILSDAEVDMVVQHNRRLVATCDLPKGTAFVRGVNFGSYRGLHENAHALSPFEADRVNGKISARHIKAGDQICDGDFT